MTYVRSLFINFLIVFFVNHVMPGVVVSSFQNDPNIGGDLLFSFILGLLNSSIFPLFVLFSVKPKFITMVVASFFITFTAFILTATTNIGVKSLSWTGVLGATSIVLLVSSISNYLEYKHAFHNDK